MVFSRPVFAQNGKQCGLPCVCYLSTEEHQTSQLCCGKRSYLHLWFEHFWGGGGVGVSAVARAARVQVVYRPHWLGSGTVPGTIKHGV